MTTYNGPVIDPHMHLWDLDGKPFGSHWPWLNGPQAIDSHFGGSKHNFDSETRRTYLPEDYVKDTQGHNVVKSVHIQAEAGDPHAETVWLQHLADRHGFPHGICPYVNLADADADRHLAFQAAHPNVRGIRQMLNWDDKDPSLRSADRDYVRDPAWRTGYALLEKYKLHFELQIWPAQATACYEFIKSFPTIQVIVNHTLLPKGHLEPTEEALAVWRAGVTKLASLPNVAIKLSGLSMTHHFPTADKMRPYLLHAISAFGVDRCMFASNFPVDRMTTTFHNLFSSFKEVVKDFSPDEQKKLFHDNASRFYRL